jgi:hypothetical protein
LREHKAFGKAVVAITCFYGEFLSFPVSSCSTS